MMMIQTNTKPKTDNETNFRKTITTNCLELRRVKNV